MDSVPRDVALPSLDKLHEGRAVHSLHFLKTKGMFLVKPSALLHPSHYMCVRHIALASLRSDAPPGTGTPTGLLVSISEGRLYACHPLALRAFRLDALS